MRLAIDTREGVVLDLRQCSRVRCRLRVDVVGCFGVSWDLLMGVLQRMQQGQ